MSAVMTLKRYGASTFGKIGARKMMWHGWENPYPTDGLIAMWDYKWNAGGGVYDPTAMSWNDLVGNVNLTLHGGCTWTSNGLAFDGTSGYADATTGLGHWANAKTLNVSLTFDTQPANIGVVELGDEISDLMIGLAGYRLVGHSNVFYRHCPDSTIVLTLHSVTKIKDVSSTPWIVDGTERQSNNSNWMSAAEEGVTTFGKRNGGTSFFQGKIRGVRVYSRVLTSADIATIEALDRERYNLP